MAMAGPSTSRRSTLQKIPLDGGPVSSIPMPIRFAGGGALFGDGDDIFVADSETIYRYSIASGETTVVATLPSYVYGIWGNGQSLFVTGERRIWRISLSTGHVVPVVVGGNGDNAGTPVEISGHLGGSDGQLYVALNTAIFRLTPSSAPPFFSFKIGWSTSVVLVNPTEENLGGVVELYSGGSLRSAAPYNIAPRSSFVYATANTSRKTPARYGPCCDDQSVIEPSERLPRGYYRRGLPG
jgi:hypothetical protein